MHPTTMDLLHFQGGERPLIACSIPFIALRQHSLAKGRCGF